MSTEDEVRYLRRQIDDLREHVRELDRRIAPLHAGLSQIMAVRSSWLEMLRSFGPYVGGALIVLGFYLMARAVLG